MKKILWLASWYPNKLSPLNGDFIQRHAEAVALFEPVQVIFVVKDELGIVTDRLTIEYNTRENLSETIAYYKPLHTGIKMADQVISIITYLKILKKLSLKFIRLQGQPRLIHVQVTLWAGLIALWLKIRYRIPYLVTEHWTGYNMHADENIFNKGWLFKTLTRAIINHAELLLPVSRQLGNFINDTISPVKFRVVPNVVDTRYFHLKTPSGPYFRFIHVSSMNRRKNVEGILHAFSKLLAFHKNLKLVMAGPAPDDLIELATHLKLKQFIEWKGMVPYQEVAKAMSNSSALVLFSRYENQPCVVLEAHCCGLPVIATRVGGIEEIIDEDNGILVHSENDSELLKAMISIIENYQKYDPIRIRSAALEKYNYNTIGKLLVELYSAY